jgi:hypothetical protein
MSRHHVITPVAGREMDEDGTLYSGGYRPGIVWGGEVVWQSETLVPFEHGDYDNDQERKAERIAEKHVVTTLRRLFARYGEPVVGEDEEG